MPRGEAAGTFERVLQPTKEVHDHRETKPTPRIAATGAIVLAAGSYGVAAAASGNDNSSTGATPQSAPLSADPQNPWGPQRSDETLLTGDTLASVKAAALARVPGATIVRIETDADGHAAYEPHLLELDGTPATVYVDKQFDVVWVETR